MCQPKLLSRLEPRVACYDAASSVDQNRNREAEFPDASRDLRNLFRRMSARVPRLWHKFRDAPRFDLIGWPMSHRSDSFEFARQRRRDTRTKIRRQREIQLDMQLVRLV